MALLKALLIGALGTAIVLAIIIIIPYLLSVGVFLVITGIAYLMLKKQETRAPGNGGFFVGDLHDQ